MLLFTGLAVKVYQCYSKKKHGCTLVQGNKTQKILTWTNISFFDNSFLYFQLGHAGDLPKSLVEDYENNEEFLKKVHHVLLEVGSEMFLFLFPVYQQINDIKLLYKLNPKTPILLTPATNIVIDWF